MESRIVTSFIARQYICIHIKPQRHILVIKTFSTIQLGSIGHNHTLSTNLISLTIQYRDAIFILSAPITTFISNLNSNKHNIFGIRDTIRMGSRHNLKTHRITGCFILIICIYYITTMRPPIIKLHVYIHI